MRTLVCTVGLPRAGKSTWINKYRTRHGWPIVEPDAIRRAVHGAAFNKRAEPTVWSTARIMVRSLFEAGHEVVVFDSTMINKDRRDIFKYEDFEVCFKEFHTPKEVCIERAHETDQDYLVPVIERMAKNRDPIEVGALHFEDWYELHFQNDTQPDGGETLLKSQVGLPGEPGRIEGMNDSDSKAKEDA